MVLITTPWPIVTWHQSTMPPRRSSTHRHWLSRHGSWPCAAPAHPTWSSCPVGPSWRRRRRDQSQRALFLPRRGLLLANSIPRLAWRACGAILAVILAIKEVGHVIKPFTKYGLVEAVRAGKARELVFVSRHCKPIAAAHSVVVVAVVATATLQALGIIVIILCVCDARALAQGALLTPTRRWCPNLRAATRAALLVRLVATT